MGAVKGAQLNMQTTAEGSLSRTKPARRRAYTTEKRMANTIPEDYRNALGPDDEAY
jgi:hypothetical protein